MQVYGGWRAIVPQCDQLGLAETTNHAVGVAFLSFFPGFHAAHCLAKALKTLRQSLCVQNLSSIQCFLDMGLQCLPNGGRKYNMLL